MEGAVTIGTSASLMSGDSISMTTTTTMVTTATIATMTSSGSGLFISDGSHRSGSDSNDLSLWLPYFCIGVLLAVLSLLSFWEYHRRNRHRYRGRTFKLNGINNHQEKYKVTLNKNGLMPTPVDVKRIVLEHQPRLATPDLAKSNRFAFIRNLYQKKASESEIIRDVHVSKHLKEEAPEMKSNAHNKRPQVLFSDVHNVDNNKSSNSESGLSENIGNNIDMLTCDETYPIRTPPTPPKRNKHNINRFRDYYFYRNSLEHSLDKDEDSGYQSNFLPSMNNTKYKENTYQQNCDTRCNAADTLSRNYNYFGEYYPNDVHHHLLNGNTLPSSSYHNKGMHDAGNILELNAQNLIHHNTSNMSMDNTQHAQRNISQAIDREQPATSAAILYNCQEDGLIYLSNAQWKETDL